MFCATRDALFFNDRIKIEIFNFKYNSFNHLYTNRRVVLIDCLKNCLTKNFLKCRLVFNTKLKFMTINNCCKNVIKLNIHVWNTYLKYSSLRLRIKKKWKKKSVTISTLINKLVSSMTISSIFERFFDLTYFIIL